MLSTQETYQLRNGTTITFFYYSAINTKALKYRY